MSIFERISDASGAVILGWLANSVLYSRFENVISAELGARFARRFGALIGDTYAVHYFSDSSAVSSYDLTAYARVVDALLAKHDQFKLIVWRPWDSPLGARARELPNAFGCFEFVHSAADFEARLCAAAPAANITTLVDCSQPQPSFGAAESLSRSAVSAPEPPPTRVDRTAAGTGALTYVFDLSDFERGQFTAVRHTHLSRRPPGAWICVARNDHRALELAREAALDEWAQPHTRPPEAFTVRFIDAAPHRGADRR